MRKVICAVCLTLCAAGYGILASAVAWAQNPIKDGQIYYYTGAATINTSLIEMVNGQLVGNDVVVGRTPDGTNLGTSLVDAFTVFMAAGAEISTQNEQHDVSVFNRNRLILNSSLNNVQAFNVNAYDGSLVTVNGGTVYNLNSFGDDTDPAKSPQVTLNGGTVFQMYLQGASQTAITGGTVSQAVQAAGMSSLLVSGGYQSLVSLTNSATLTASGGRTNTLRADGMAQVTINNSAQVGQLGVSGMATATVNGGSINLVSAGNYSPFFGQSHVVVNNGSINTLNASGNTTIDLHGGTVQNAEIGGENVTFNMDGGTIAGHLKVEAGTTNNLSGGSVGELDVYQNAIVNLRGGTMISPIRLLDTGLLNVYGNDLQIVGTSAWSQLIDGNLRSGTAYNVTGILQNNNTLSNFVIYDQDSGYTYDALNPARQFNLFETGNSPVTIQDNIYYITSPLTVTADLKGYDVVVGRSPSGAPGSPGDVNLGTTDADKYTVTFAAGTNTTHNGDSDGYFGVEVFNKNTALVTGGTIGFLNTYDNSVADVRGGTVFELQTFDTSQAQVSGGSKISFVANLYNSSHLDVSGGSVESLYALDNSTLAVSSGTVSNLTATGATRIAVSGGTITGDLTARNHADVNISGGTMHYVNLTDNVTATFTGGFVDYDGPSAPPSGVVARDNSHVTVTGGELRALATLQNGSADVGGNALVNDLNNSGVGLITVGGNAQIGVAICAPSGVINGASLRVSDNATIKNAYLNAGLFELQGGVIQQAQVENSSARSSDPTLAMSGGTIQTLSVGANGHVNLSGGTVNTLTASSNAVVKITGGTIDLAQLSGNSFTTMYGGHIGTVKRIGNAFFYIGGGTIGNNTIYSLGDGLTSLVAQSYTLGDGIVANYTDVDTGLTYYGFFHDLNATFADGSLLSTRYFEAVSDNTGTQYHPQFAFSAAPAAGAPEAPSLLLCVIGFVLFGVGRGRRGKRAKSLLSHRKRGLLGILKA